MHSLTSEGADASEDGTGRGTPIVLASIDMRNAGRASGTGAGTQGDGSREGGPSYAVTSTEMALPAVAVGFYTTQDPISSEERVPAIGAKSNGNGVHADTVVRRLTELECERLQGFPDGWTAGQSGAARYRQLGNAVAGPCVEWIIQRLVTIDNQLSEES